MFKTPGKLLDFCFSALPLWTLHLNKKFLSIFLQAVDVVGQAGKPKTITGFQTHTTPVLLAYGERAELATDECILDICNNDDNVQFSIYWVRLAHFKIVSNFFPILPAYSCLHNLSFGYVETVWTISYWLHNFLSFKTYLINVVKVIQHVYFQHSIKLCCSPFLRRHLRYFPQSQCILLCGVTQKLVRIASETNIKLRAEVKLHISDLQKIILFVVKIF